MTSVCEKKMNRTNERMVNIDVMLSYIIFVCILFEIKSFFLETKVVRAQFLNKNSTKILQSKIVAHL